MIAAQIWRRRLLARERYRNRTPEQIERKRDRQREWYRAGKGSLASYERGLIENMTPEQIDRKRQRGRIENMTPELIERKRARDRQRRADLRAWGGRVHVIARKASL